MVLASVSTRVPRQNGHVAGRLTASLNRDSDIVGIFPSGARVTHRMRSGYRSIAVVKDRAVPTNAELQGALSPGITLTEALAEWSRTSSETARSRAAP
jgi:hypothetical protein